MEIAASNVYQLGYIHVVSTVNLPRSLIAAALSCGLLSRSRGHAVRNWRRDLEGWSSAKFFTMNVGGSFRAGFL